MQGVLITKNDENTCTAMTKVLNYENKLGVKFHIARMPIITSVYIQFFYSNN